MTDTTPHGKDESLVQAATIHLNFKTGERNVNQLCMECFMRKHEDLFEPDGDVCKDCREQYE